MRSALMIALGVAHAPITSAQGLSEGCSSYLHAKGLNSPDDLQRKLPMCSANDAVQGPFAPDPHTNTPGVTDTTDLSCRYGNPAMFDRDPRKAGTCCGMRPHFNWVVSTCEKTGPTGQFCSAVPECALEGSPKINYVASYQYNGSHFVMMDESSAGEVGDDGISGDYHAGTGWERAKDNFRWVGGDWTTKYAPSARGDGKAGPRGVTPPAGLWILSAENFYYAAFYMLSQLGINLEAKHQPTGTNCWMWELDPVEGTLGWAPHKPAPGNINQLYTTDNAQASGCMPLAFMASQVQGGKHEFQSPETFKDYCAANPTATGCQPWVKGQDVDWSGGASGTARFENYWDQPYTFAVVVDQAGYWTYRWRPDEQSGATGWAGVTRHHADRVLPARPAPITDPKGLRSNVPGDAQSAVIYQPSLSPDASCRRSSIEAVDWNWGASALGSMAAELGGAGAKYAGAQNWWAHFADTQQQQGYPLSIAGVPSSEMPHDYTCNTDDHLSCSCGGSAPPAPAPAPPASAGGWQSTSRVVADEGNTLGSSHGTLQQCQEACTSTAGCHSVSYSSKWSACFLKDKCVTASASLSGNTAFQTYFIPCADAPAVLHV